MVGIGCSRSRPRRKVQILDHLLTSIVGEAQLPHSRVGSGAAVSSLQISGPLEAGPPGSSTPHLEPSKVYTLGTRRRTLYKNVRKPESG